ncbi:light-inducible protein CPRF2 [Triticum aestivum]|uniref:light-inducible protein CPRF2 n=1 Tax=Triticum aestivum TaxID=4565 RepID=UPI001D01BEF4|nr:light-inducible protein CPRF2-like [Triticum aestivum]
MECSGDEVVELSCARAGGDPGEYAAVLKRKLQLYCAAVAKTMEAKPQESSLNCLNSQASDTSPLVSQASFDCDGTVVQGKPANSCTSKEQSDDDDGDLEENTDPASAKRVKRMLSNRESARRSRKRKQAHQNDIESQVTQLRAENASLLKRLTDMTQKYKEASLGNRNLTVDIETMRRKVNIAEEAVRRVTGASLMFSTTSNNVPLASCVSVAASADAVPTEENMSHFLQGLLEDDLIKHDLPEVATPLPNGEEMTSRPASLRRVASLENLQKRIHRDSVHSEDMSIFPDHEVPANAQ